MNAQLIRNIFYYKEVRTKTDENIEKPKRRSLFMLRVPRELFLTRISPKQQVTNHVFIVIMNNFNFFFLVKC